MSDELMQRVMEWLNLYGSPTACAAELLCDRHDPASTAYHLVAADLSSQSLSYGELRADSERVAAGLKALGVQPGDRVATLMGKSRAFLSTLLGIWRLGAVHVPLFTAFAPPAIALRLSASRTSVVVCDSGQRSKLDPSEAIPAGPPWRVVATGDCRDGDVPFETLLASTGNAPAAALGGDAPLIHIFTSGTTGTAKGVVVPIRALASFRTYAEYALGILPNDRFWNAADPGWAYGLYFGVLASFVTGVESYLLEGGFSAETTLGLLERYGITNFTAAPTAYRAMRSQGLTGRGLVLRAASSAGEPLTREVNEWALEALGLEVRDHYGQTETGMLINNHQHAGLRLPLRLGSMGQPMPGWSAAVLRAEADEPAPAGEIGRVAMDLRASPLAWFKGYEGDLLKSSEKFTSDGRWYLTGDTGRMDEDGYYYFSAREDDVIIMAGYRIGPVDVETVILRHPAIAECAVVAVPDEVRGEILEAVVVLVVGHAPSDALSEELRARVKNEFAAHAYPRRVHYVDALPKTPSGKIQRFVVRQQLRQGRSDSQAGR